MTPEEVLVRLTDLVKKRRRRMDRLSAAAHKTKQDNIGYACMFVSLGMGDVLTDIATLREELKKEATQ
jgi:hypothetical protein